jgi:hypothetical protein
MRPKTTQILFITLVMLFFALQCSKIKTAPDDLIGVWKTSDPKYEDRFFEVDRSTITFGKGGGDSDTHSITSIEIEKGDEARGNLYTIAYKDKEGQKFTFLIYYNPANQGTIRFKNQDQIEWTRQTK